MPLSRDERIELLEKARAVKASKKAERDANKIPPKKGRPKKETKTLNLDDVADETNVEEVANDLKNMDIKADDIKADDIKADDIKADDIKEEPTKEKTELQEEQEQEQDDVQIIEEVVKKPKKKKKIIRRYIEPSSSSEEEVVEEYIKAKKKLKEPKAPRYHPYPKQDPKQEPEPIQLTPPTLNLFCY